MVTLRSRREQNGWQLYIADSIATKGELIDGVLAAMDGDRAPFRRSRHAATYEVRALCGDASHDVFVKCFDPPSRLDRLKSLIRGLRAERAEHATALLLSAGFSAAPILLRGIHRRSGREFLVTARLEGDGPLVALSKLPVALSAKRVLLRALGSEVGRLHRAGFIHGDLTPFNIRIATGEPPRFGFLDNERTRRNGLLWRRRHRLRNLVQLGRFALPGITRTDRMRVLQAYELELYGCASPSLARAAAVFLNRRMQRDRANTSHYR
jgi:Lipopolysaccharide kinase (Kdo/WaaP) family